jgi:hypothetical protein
VKSSNYLGPLVLLNRRVAVEPDRFQISVFPQVVDMPVLFFRSLDVA